MPSHRSAEEAAAASTPASWHACNAEADGAAKVVAREHDVSPALLGNYREHAVTAEPATATVAAIQLRRLKARARTAEGAAAKGRCSASNNLACRGGSRSIV